MIPFPTDVRDPKFVEKLNWYDAQTKQDKANQKVHDEYLQYVSNYMAANLHNAELGLPIEQPKAVPVMTLYLDDLTIGHTPFPDLKLPVITVPMKAAGAGAMLAGANPQGATIDAQATLLMLQHVVEQLILIGTDIGAIKSKLGI
jgi:hypothetical protein